MVKTLIAATALSVMAGAAFAGEGNGNPFPFQAPPISVSTLNYTQGPGVSQNPFPYTTPGIVMNSVPVLPSSGSAGAVQTANSLPPGFMDGVPGQANVNQNVRSPRLLAQPVAPTTGSRG